MQLNAKWDCPCSAEPSLQPTTMSRSAVPQTYTHKSSPCNGIPVANLKCSTADTMFGYHINGSQRLNQMCKSSIRRALSSNTLTASLNKPQNCCTPGRLPQVPKFASCSIPGSTAAERTSIPVACTATLQAECTTTAAERHMHGPGQSAELPGRMPLACAA
jgi:hypothetical protein